MLGSTVPADRCEPNLVPILDMVFQLITFFMLVINFKATAVDHDLTLPVVGSAQPADDKLQGDLLVFNLRANGEAVVRGNVLANIEGFIGVEAKIVASLKGLTIGTPLPVTVVIRADRSITVQAIMRVVNSCRSNGFDKFDFVITRSAEIAKGS